MSRKERILYVVSRSIEINTSASIRNRATIQGLLKLGYDIDIVSIRPNKDHQNYEKVDLIGPRYIYFDLNSQIYNGKLQKKINKNIYIALKKIVYKYISKRQIYDNFKGIVKYIDQIDLEKYDLIISSSDPKSSHLFVKELKNKYRNNRIPWIQIWGDPFFGDITLAKKKRVLNEIKNEENSLLETADSIVYVSRLTLEEQKNRYPQYAKKMSYVPIPYLNKKETYVENLSEKKEIKLAYCGDYNSKIRNIIPLYNAVKNYKKFFLTICGMSDIKLETCPNILVYPRISSGAVDKIEVSTDILVHLSNLSGGQIPGKIYQHLGTNKPILFILDGEKEKLKAVFEKYDRVKFCNNNREDIQNKLDEIVKENRKYYPLEEFSGEEIAKKIINTVFRRDTK